VRILILAIFATGCIAQAINAISVPTRGDGTSTCRQIVENCDSQCHDPMCLRNCSSSGTAEAAQQHAALLDCAQANACTDEDCVRTGCPSQSQTCEGPASAPPPEPPASAPPPEPPAS
jgi:hypothetical protein